jgi:DNA-binding XRE family transcriptional regulator
MTDQHINVGARIRAFRQGKGLSLVELSRRTGIAPSNLSSIELNKSSPTLATLMKIAHAFDMRIGEFLANALYSKAVLARAPALVSSQVGPAGLHVHHFTESVSFNKMDAFMVTVVSGLASPPPLEPGTDRILCCLLGEIRASADDQTYDLSMHDILYLLPEASAMLENLSENPSVALVIRCRP